MGESSGVSSEDKPTKAGLLHQKWCMSRYRPFLGKEMARQTIPGKIATPQGPGLRLVFLSQLPDPAQRLGSESCLLYLPRATDQITVLSRGLTRVPITYRDRAQPETGLHPITYTPVKQFWSKRDATIQGINPCKKISNLQMGTSTKHYVIT